jgi:hypothetical protein
MTRDIHLSTLLKRILNLKNTNFVQKEADALCRKTLREHTFLFIINFSRTFSLIKITSAIPTNN